MRGGQRVWSGRVNRFTRQGAAEPPSLPEARRVRARAYHRRVSRSLASESDPPAAFRVPGTARAHDPTEFLTNASEFRPRAALGVPGAGPDGWGCPLVASVGAAAWSAGEVAAMDDPFAPVRDALALPGTVGVVASISYELGRRIEPAAGGPSPPADPRAFPAVVAHRLVAKRGSAPWVGSGSTFRVGRFRSEAGGPGFRRAVARAVEYIHAGDCFQVNLAHRLSAEFEGSVRGLAGVLLERIAPSMGAYIEVPDSHGAVRGAVLSLSPELFLRYDAATGRVVTRPIKGTRAVGAGIDALAQSSKDAAELAMIVDLMRNDLGRSCRPGSIRVERPRDIESFGLDPLAAVRHTVATVSGELAAGKTVFDLIAGAFPPGSVTGAPKIRAMQIIEELETCARGPYCGAIGWFGADGSATLSVPIRTAVVHLDPGSTPERASGVIDLHVGAGIVAESDPMAEWFETLHKAGTILSVLGQDAEAIE